MFSSNKPVMINRIIDFVPLGLIAIAAIAPLPASAGEAPPEPDTYRMEAYRAPTPQTLAGARVLTTSEAKSEWRNGAVFVDVLPRPPKPDNLPEGTIWRPPTRLNIPGSICVNSGDSIPIARRQPFSPDRSPLR